jgi:DNA-binding NarL/FixJ family response regulator
VVHILLVDDSEPFRRVVISRIQRQPELQVICEAADGLDAVERAEELHPELILLDIGLPSLCGIEAARRMRDGAPQSRILFLTQESSPEIVDEAFKLGACGYIVKLDAGRDLLPGINAVVRGEKFVSSSLTRQKFAKYTHA